MTPQREAVARRPAGHDPKVEEAEAIAIEALSFLATDSTRLLRFLDLTGLTPQTLRTAAGSPGFLSAVIEHVAADPSLVETYAANSGREAGDIARAREILSGHQPWVST